LSLKISSIHLDSLETELPAFANPPLMQRLYEEAVPPLIQDWIWCKSISHERQR